MQCPEQVCGTLLARVKATGSVLEWAASQALGENLAGMIQSARRRAAIPPPSNGEVLTGAED